MCSLVLSSLGLLPENDCDVTPKLPLTFVFKVNKGFFLLIHPIPLPLSPRGKKNIPENVSDDYERPLIERVLLFVCFTPSWYHDGNNFACHTYDQIVLMVMVTIIDGLKGAPNKRWLLPEEKNAQRTTISSNEREKMD